ncbi:MAG: c-type cytochrome [Gammaproteobacteria bacterium]|nr:c-type cytochrome [Gammaproteobacteria bacterium]
MQQKLKNTRYHTEENGWFNHEKYKIAYPFATGEIPLDIADEKLSEIQRSGKQLFLASCISCHDRGKVNQDGVIWESRPLSWPRNKYTHKQVDKADAISQASPYALHDIQKVYVPGSDSEKKGQIIFQNNCAFCHAPDGSGKHWIGQFIEPHPKNFTEKSIQVTYSKQELKTIISNGKENTAMPAWRYVLSEEQIEYVISYMWQRYN